MTFANLVKQGQKVVSDNGPAILTALGATGALTTAYLAGRASFKAAEIIAAEEAGDDLRGAQLDFREKVNLVWKLYASAVAMAVISVTCIVFANRLGTRRAAAMAAAFSISEKGWLEYKDKVVEKLGKNKERAVRDEIAQDQIDRNPASGREVIITGAGEVLCYDSISGRYFKSTVETLRKAENDINREILNNMSASLYEFYDLIGLPSTPFSSEVGWNTDNQLVLNFSTCLAEDGQPAVSVNYATYPIRGYASLR